MKNEQDDMNVINVQSLDEANFILDEINKPPVKNKALVDALDGYKKSAEMGFTDLNEKLNIHGDT